MNKCVKTIWKWGSMVNSWIERCSALLHIIIMLIVVFVSSQAIAFSIVYIQLLNETEINMMCFQYINIDRKSVV